MTTPVVEIQALHKTRRQGGVGFELRIPEFCLHPGEFVAVIGKSGCGKSTLLDCLALVLRPGGCDTFMIHAPAQASTQRLDIAALWATENEPELARARRNHLGYVLQTGGLLPFLTVQQNILLPPRIKGIQDREALMKQRAQAMGVAELLPKKPQYLSGGQRQRVAILRALSHDPMLVLADEPTAAVDQERALQIVQDFRRLAQEENSSIVMVTHDRELVTHADRVFGFQLEQIEADLVRSTCCEVSL